MNRATGIDLSRWNLGFNPQNAKRPPDFVVQRASYGLVKDPLFDKIYAGVSRIDIRGAYHYFSSAAGWKMQADWFLNIVENKGFRFYVCDFEGSFNQMSVDFASAAIEWMRYVKAMTKLPVLVYTNRSLYTTYLAKDYRAGEFPLWISDPIDAMQIKPDPQTDTPQLPQGRDNWLFWQYSFGEHNSYGSEVGTESRGCDMDVFNGTVDNMKLWLGIEGVIPPVVTVPTLESLDKRLKVVEGMHGVT